MTGRARTCALLLLAFLAAGVDSCDDDDDDYGLDSDAYDEEWVVDPSDLMLRGDPVDPASGEIAGIVPGAPWIRPGPDDELGTADDEIRSDVIGDVDLVARVGTGPFAAAFQLPAPLRGAVPDSFAIAFGQGAPVPFVVSASSGLGPDPAGTPVNPSYWEGLGLLVLAFADLDADGFVGVTHLDGNPGDAALEAAELEPVARRYAVGRHGIAKGTLSVGVGGPAGTSVAIAAAAFAGPYDDPDVACATCHAWPGDPAVSAFSGPFDVAGANPVPSGPMVMTRLPFLPDDDPSLRSGPRGIVPVHPDGRVAVEPEVAFVPDPVDPRVGEAFTLRLDGSDPSIDVARVFPGAPTRFGLVRPAAPGPVASRTLRPGLGPDGAPALMEVLGELALSGEMTLRIVALDALSNVTDPGAPVRVTASARPGLRIVSPDADGNPARERLRVTDARGVEIVLAPSADGPGDPGNAALLLEAPGTLSRVDFAEPADESD